MKVKTCESLVSYDIKRYVKNCLITATLVQIIKDNPFYRRQLKEMLAGKRRRKLPKVDMIDHAALEIDIQISGCFLSYGVMDEVSGVNIKIEAIAHQLNFSQLETTRTVKLANGARMVLVESLSKVPTLIGGKHILLNYMIMRLDMSST